MNTCLKRGYNELNNGSKGFLTDYQYETFRLFFNKVGPKHKKYWLKKMLTNEMEFKDVVEMVNLYMKVH